MASLLLAFGLALLLFRCARALGAVDLGWSILMHHFSSVDMGSQYRNNTQRHVNSGWEQPSKVRVRFLPNGFDRSLLWSPLARRDALSVSQSWNNGLVASKPGRQMHWTSSEPSGPGFSAPFDLDGHLGQWSYGSLSSRRMA